MWAVEMSGVSKSYRMEQVQVPALAEVSLKIATARFTVLSGQSGSGKTTLLNLIGGIDRADAGEIAVAGQDLGRLSDDALSDFRARHIGFIFQNFNLMPVLSAFENVEYPLQLQGLPARQRRGRALEMLAAVGLADKAAHRPGQLSGGQRQRVAIARALVHEPALVLADEPTANLDSHTGASILALLRQLQRERQVAVVFSSHDPQVIAAADDRYLVRDGRVGALKLEEALA
ncbi:ABC transporter ATP-binding protein [Chromobacterium aquaticum]|uniref:ABC transporter ATP-binding protein n=1 Tax=Chromobacterium aquaticum TaxID=467180 RepID=A0ABV8ZWP1_9NEIS|nr:ABC transporter ATP-binding protein [Chromobacterium aquaticum]MCD5362731.1 ABC transporter ATP-binding protein [Chromobacterium aquaticum]